MVRYRQELIRQSNYLLLQLAGLRIEQEKWRDAPVVRGPGGRFASNKNLDSTITNMPIPTSTLRQLEREVIEHIDDVARETAEYSVTKRPKLPPQWQERVDNAIPWGYTLKDKESQNPDVIKAFNEKRKQVHEAIVKAREKSAKLAKRSPAVPATEFKAMSATISKNGSAIFETTVNTTEGTTLPVKMNIPKRQVSDVSFSVNNDYNINNAANISREERSKLTKKLIATFKSFISQQEDGRVFKCLAYAGDEHELTRTAVYELMGFSPRDVVAGKYMYGVVKDGRLYPSLRNGTIIQ